MSVLREALDALRGAEADWFGEEITYRAASGLETDATAVPGRTVFSQRGEYGLFVRIETRDFIVRRDSLAEPPRKGDEIVFDGKVYEVVAPGGEPAWRWSDALCTAYRIHTKLTGDES